MIALGLFAMWAAASDILRRWSYLTSGARICDALILASGLLLFTAGAWLFLTREQQAWAAALGSLSAGLFAATMFVGVWSGAIPCSGPG